MPAFVIRMEFTGFRILDGVPCGLRRAGSLTDLLQIGHLDESHFAERVRASNIAAWQPSAVFGGRSSTALPAVMRFEPLCLPRDFFGPLTR